MDEIKLHSKTFEGWQFDGKFESGAEIYHWIKAHSETSNVKASNYKLSSNFQEAFLEFTLSWQFAGKTESRQLSLVIGDYLVKTKGSFETVKKALADRYFTVEKPETAQESKKEKGE